MNVCLHGKICKKKKIIIIKKKDDLSKKKNCKDNLRTLFVEIPSYKGQRTGLPLGSALPNLT